MGEVLLSATELAGRLSLTKGRISQYVAQGKLPGCFSGDGRARRFDLAKVCDVLGKTLDFGQMMGNGAGTRRAIVAMRDDLEQPEADGRDMRQTVELARSQLRQARPQESGELPRGDNDRYEMARTAKAEEDLRSARLRNGREEGLYVLASEVEVQVVRILAQEVAEMEAVLRDGARAIADGLGVDFRSARQILLDTWRGHRAKRSVVLDSMATTGAATEAETDGNI